MRLTSLKLYKYLNSRYVNDYLDGKILFRSLSYYQNFEDKQVRSDTAEGSIKYQKNGGVVVTKVESGEELNIPYSFQSMAKTEEILVHCLSTKIDHKIAEEFESDSCIEIASSGNFLNRIRSLLRVGKKRRNAELLFGEVSYKSKSEFDGIEWALPDRLVMRKDEEYFYQKEYRIALADKTTLSVENVDLGLFRNNSNSPGESRSGSYAIIKLGNIEKMCHVHRFT